MIPRVSKISYIRKDGIAFALYSKARKNYAWYTRHVDSDSGMVYGDVVVFPPQLLASESWSQQALNTTHHPFASLGHSWHDVDNPLVLSTARVGDNEVFSFGFELKSFMSVLRGIIPFGGGFYLATKDGNVLVLLNSILDKSKKEAGKIQREEKPFDLIKFPNQTSIYKPTTAYATYRYGTSPHQIPKKLEQPLILGGREGIPDYCRLAHKCSEGWDASREYLFPGVCDDTEHTSHLNPEPTRGTTLLSRVEPQILPGRRGLADMDLFSLIRAPNPAKVKIGTRPRAAHEVPLLTVTASRVIEMEDPAAATDSSGETVAPEVPPPEDVTTTRAAPKAGQAKGIAATDPHVAKEQSTRGGKTLAAIELGMGSTRPVPASQGAPVDGAAAAGDPESENTSFTSMVGSPESIYRPEWARQVVIGSQLRLRFEQETKLLKKFVAQVAYQDERIQARENEIKNLETLLEAEADIKKAAEGRNAELSKELENVRPLFFDLQVSNNRLSRQVSTLQVQVMGEEKLKAAFKEFKQYEDNRVEQRCVEMDARLVMKCGESTELRQAFIDVVSAGNAKGMSEVLKHGVEHGKANLSLEAIEAFDPEAEAKYIATLHALKDLKYPIVDQLKSLKDAPMDVIVASLHLKNDTGDDAPQWIDELRPSSS
nr:histidine kinase CKI1 [Tanacetum cinerariifolium]